MHSLMKLAYFILIGTQEGNKNQTLAWGFSDEVTEDVLDGDMEFVDGATFLKQKEKTITEMKWNEKTKEIEGYNADGKKINSITIPEIIEFAENKDKYVTGGSYDSSKKAFIYTNSKGKTVFEIPVTFESDIAKINEDLKKLKERIESAEDVIMSNTKKVDNALSQLEKITPITDDYKLNADRFFASVNLNSDKTQMVFSNKDNKILASIEMPTGGGGDVDTEQVTNIVNQYFQNITYDSNTGDLIFKDNTGKVINTVNIPPGGSGGSGGTGGGGQGSSTAPPAIDTHVIINDMGYDFGASYPTLSADTKISYSDQWGEFSMKMGISNLIPDRPIADDFSNTRYAFKMERLLGKWKNQIYDLSACGFWVEVKTDRDYAKINSFVLVGDSVFAVWADEFFVGTNNTLRMEFSMGQPGKSPVKFGTWDLQSRSSGTISMSLSNKYNCEIDQDVRDGQFALIRADKTKTLCSFDLVVKADGKPIMRKLQTDGISTIKDQRNIVTNSSGVAISFSNITMMWSGSKCHVTIDVGKIGSGGNNLNLKYQGFDDMKIQINKV